MEAARLIQQIRVDLVTLSRIKEQAVNPDDEEMYQARGEQLRTLLIRTAADILEKHREIKQPPQEQEGSVILFLLRKIQLNFIK